MLIQHDEQTKKTNEIEDKNSIKIMFDMRENDTYLLKLNAQI